MDGHGPGEQLLNIEIPKALYKDKLKACQEALFKAHEEIQALTSKVQQYRRYISDNNSTDAETNTKPMSAMSFITP